jgi:cysteine desulfurase/selenocysteine lyase
MARDEFPIVDRWVSLNNAGIAPTARSAAQAMSAQLDDAVLNGSASMPVRFQLMEQTRAKAARFIGADPSEVAFIRNTSEGLAFVAEGINWRQGDRVLVPDCEFPSNVLPWLHLERLGVEVVRVRSDPDTESLSLSDFEEGLDRGRVRLVAASWVQWTRGWRLDLRGLADLCHRYGALLCVDLIQGVGAIPLNLNETGVDFAAAGAQKWLVGPYGTGLFYVADRRLDVLNPVIAGWYGMEDIREGRWVKWHETAKRFEGGIANFSGIVGLGAAIDVLEQARVPAIWRHVQRLTSKLTNGLRSLGADVTWFDNADHRSGIVSFAFPDRDADALEQTLERAGVLTTARVGRLRVSPHGYNNDEDVNRFLNALDDALGA